jgi:hypothetical protein
MKTLYHEFVLESSLQEFLPQVHGDLWEGAVCMKGFLQSCVTVAQLPDAVASYDDQESDVTLFL